METPQPVPATLAPVSMGTAFNDPPPPPPPQYALPPVISYSPEAFSHQYRDPVDIVEHHEELQDSRENLMGTRFRMQAKRREIRTFREQIGKKEGILIDQLRMFFLDQEINLPRNVLEAWDQVDGSRNTLNTMESEYDVVEEKYHSQEIKYTADEGRFIENLLQRSSMANLPVDHDQNASSLTTQVIDERYSRSPFRLTETRAQIDDWLLQLTKESSFQKLQLRAIQGIDKLDKDDQDAWWDRVEQSWTLDSSADTQLHNGNSTFSQGIGSQPPSAADLVKPGSDSMDLKDTVPRDLLPGDPDLDAAENPKLAPTIESEDLYEETEIQPPTHHEQKNDDTAKSVSTDPSQTHRTISSDEFATNTTTEQTCSCSNSSTCQDHSILSENQTRPSTHIDRQLALMSQRRRSPLSTPRQDTRDSEDPVGSPPLILQPGSPKHQSATLEPPTSDWPIELVDDYKSDERDPVSTSDDHTPRLRPHETSVSPCPSFDTSKSSTIDHASPVASVGTPPIRMTQPKHSSQLFLPILQLTPDALSEVSVSTNALNLPFVDISDSTLRLPGPISEDMYM